MTSGSARAAALWAGGWIAAGAVVAAGLGFGMGFAPVAAALGGLALTAPLAAGAALAVALGRMEAAEARLGAVERAAAARPEPAPGPVLDASERAELTRALAAAARDALDRERGAIARQIAELGEAQRRLDAAVAALVAAPPPVAPPPPAREPEVEPQAAPAPPPADVSQPALPLAGADAPSAPDWGTIARALDFPRDGRDEAGFAALESATRDSGAAAVLQAAEDALTLLAQHGLYMEDLAVRHAPAATWRRFADGARGPTVAAVGGVEAPEVVGRVRELMKSDPILRDTGMHLMRRFDSLLRRAVADPAGEAALLAMADSRTGRAFMLTAQAVGAFD